MKFEEQLTIGDLLRGLNGIDNTKDVRFDFGYFRPSGVGSYRGYYSDLSFRYTIGREYPTVQEVIDMLENAIGKDFEGYKGGSYTMSVASPVWVANYGEASGVAVVDVLDLGHAVILETELVDY